MDGGLYRGEGVGYRVESLGMGNIIMDGGIHVYSDEGV